MPSARESRAALQLLTGAATGSGGELLSRLSGRPESQRLTLLETVPGLIDYYSDGSSALALDFYEEQRELAGVVTQFVPSPAAPDRVVKVRRAVAWASEPLFAEVPDVAGVASRLGEVIQLEVARPYRATVLANTAADPAAVGWKRITNGGCKLCRMLADRGAVFKETTATFAAHPNCHCTAAPVFVGGEIGPEASALQYRASSRNRTAKQQANLREYLNEFY